ncbi:MAG: PQQ-binding-like beta-propeller repeat protein, partial [Thaumarchaeota archaeon]|nr:PQQ-binding-like beta-propeller repeat protein [Nitrososphaerota archaeon]
QMLYGPVFYTEGQVLITGVGVSGRVDSGRGFIAGLDLRTGKLLWRFFLMPPAGGDPKWSLSWKGKGNIEPLEGDWGNARGVGVGAGSGQWAIDEETGIVYVTTSSPAPKWNATYRPGPNLFSSTILALAAISGELIWYFQSIPHDVSGLGCDWNVILGRTRIGGIEKKVVYKACGNGLVHALDAATGKAIWVFKPPSVMYLSTPNSLYPLTGNADIQLPFANAPSHEAYWQCPGITGAISSDMALAYDKVFVATYNFCDQIKPNPVEPGKLDSFGAIFPQSPYVMPKNATIYALDAGSGKIVWNFSMDNEGYTGGLLASGGVLYAGGVDKNFYAIEAETGKLLFKRIIGSPIAIGPIIAANAIGRQQLLISTGGHPERWGMPVSGFITTLALREALPVSPKNPEKSSVSEGVDIRFILLIVIVMTSLVVVIWRVKKSKLIDGRSAVS